MSYGCTGKALFVNLSTGELTEEQLDELLFRRFLGGYGLGARIIYERQPAGADPLGADNILGFTPGLLAGTGAPFSGRFMIVGKSPLTGTWGDSNVGGLLGSALKQNGFDALFFTGIAERPVWLYIEDGRVELRDAGALWGLDTKETEATIRGGLGDKPAGIAVIGPAGEARSLMACIISDGGRAAGRSGLGAVMGAKRLKAVVALTNEPVAVADEQGFGQIKDGVWARLKPPPFFQRALLSLLTPLMPRLTRLMAARGINRMPGARTVAHIFGQQGTASGLATQSESGDAPVKNWAGIAYRDFPILGKSSRISDVNVLKYKTGRYRCGGVCPLGCGGFVTVAPGPYAVRDARKPEYETLAAFGTMTLNDNVESIIKCNDICNRYGLDTISTGAAVAFAIECYEADIIGREDTGGLPLAWGDAAAIVALTEQIARREGFGAALADGVAGAAAHIGKGSEKYAVHVHGQEPGMHDPKFAPSWATSYITDPTPGRHTAGSAAAAEGRGMDFPLPGIDLPPLERYQYSGKGEAQAAWSNFTQVLNCLGLCMFGGFVGGLPYVELVNAATGWDCSARELLTIGERIQTMRQLFNVREGLRPGDFKLPDRVVGKPPPDSGPAVGITVDVKTMAADYYAAMGWDPATGRPSDDRLKLLDLTSVVDPEG